MHIRSGEGLARCVIFQTAVQDDIFEIKQHALTRRDLLSAPPAHPALPPDKVYEIT